MSYETSSRRPDVQAKRFGPRSALRTGTVALMAMALSACASMSNDLSDGLQALGLSQPAAAPATVEIDIVVESEFAPLESFLVEATQGDVVQLQDPRSGSTVLVTAGRRYYAASGRRCRTFSATPPPGYAGLSRGLACRKDFDAWRFSQSIINPDDLVRPR